MSLVSTLKRRSSECSPFYKKKAVDWSGYNYVKNKSELGRFEQRRFVNLPTKGIRSKLTTDGLSIETSKFFLCSSGSCIPGNPHLSYYWQYQGTTYTGTDRSRLYNYILQIMKGWGHSKPKRFDKGMPKLGKSESLIDLYLCLFSSSSFLACLVWDRTGFASIYWWQCHL